MQNLKKMIKMNLFTILMFTLCGPLPKNNVIMIKSLLATALSVEIIKMQKNQNLFHSLY